MSATYTTRILITGVGGFLGQQVCRELRSSGAHVTGIDRRPLSKNNDTTSQPHAFIQLDLASELLFEQLKDRPFDTIFHLAGMAYAAKSVEEPAVDFVDNLAATFNLLNVLRRCEFAGRLVYTSTAAVYGESQQLPIDEETLTRPISPYGVSKLAAEEYIRVFSAIYGFRAVIARIFSLYGPGQKKQVIYDILCKTLLADGPIALLGDGRDVRDFLYVSDAARALAMLAASAKVGSTVFNLCSGRGDTIAALAQLVVTTADGDVGRIVFSGHQRAGEPLCWIGCSEKLFGIGFSLQVGLSTGVAETVKWFRRHHECWR